MVRFRFGGGATTRGEQLCSKATVMVSGERKDEDVEQALLERSPKGSDRPTLLGVRDAAEPVPVRMTVHGIAPPGPGSDRPPPMSAQELAGGVLSNSPRPAFEEEGGDRTSHTRRSENPSAGGGLALPPLDPLPAELKTEPHPYSPPAPELSEEDREDLKNSAEEVTSPDIEMDNTKRARERFRTSRGGGRNRESGGREHAAAYVPPLTLTPSAGSLGTASGIKVDTTVLEESRYHVTEPSLLVRRETSYPPAPGRRHGPTTAVLLMIVLVSATVAAGAVYFSLKISEPEPTPTPRLVNLPEEEEEGDSGDPLIPPPEVEEPGVAQEAARDDSSAAHAVAPRPRPKPRPNAVAATRPGAKVDSEPKAKAEVSPAKEPEAEVDEAESPSQIKKQSELWLE
jgi:hypothetical protein